MKRLAIILVAVIVVMAAALIIAPSLISPELARVRITEQITQWIGRPVSFVGEPDISFFPRPSVRLGGVTIKDGDGSGAVFISVEELTGTVRWLPLLLGRIEISSFELTRPVISLRVNEEGRSNWTFERGAVAERVAQAQEDPANAIGNERQEELALGRFQIRDGTVTYQEPGAELATLSEVTLDIDWPSTSQPATARGSLVWRGELVAISASLREPLELIAGRVSPGRFSVGADPIQIVFDGTVGCSELDFSFDGQTTVSMGSLRRVIRWAGTPIADDTTLGAAAISGRGSWAWPVLSFTQAEMRLDGNEAIGAFSVDFSGDRISIIGTLALDELDLTIYAEAFRADVEAEGTWRDAEIRLPAFANFDSDVRISADRLIIGATHLEGLAASAIVKDGTISLRLGEAGFYGGHIQASLTAEYRAPRLAAEARLVLSDVNTGAALSDLVGLASISGQATGTLEAATEGATWGELVQRLTGILQTTIVNGSMLGIDLSEVAAMPVPTVDAVSVGQGEIEFAVFDASFSFFGGQFLADRVEAEGAGFDLDFVGWGSLTTPAVGGQGVVWLDGDERNRSLPFLLTGTWLNPVFSDGPAPSADIPR